VRRCERRGQVVSEPKPAPAHFVRVTERIIHKRESRGKSKQNLGPEKHGGKFQLTIEYIKGDKFTNASNKDLP
jgi:hypothetical protein